MIGYVGWGSFTERESVTLDAEATDMEEFELFQSARNLLRSTTEEDES